ncbi:MAG: HNH endonuclease [Myxococcales bacterium]|nr:HNH endonuclease [Myxococcales bacterium]MCB9716691.1 HNH endonuclease [Myxococcales bacterium]
MPRRALRRTLRRWHRRVRTLVWLVVVLGVAWWLHERGELPGPSRADPGEPEAVSSVPYDRDDWPHWIDADGDCQDTRQEVLVAESEIPVRFTTARRCKVAKGRWRCPYTGRTFTDPAELDVDHMVPLHEAHRSGGHAWDRQQRQQYANELREPAHLVAVDKGANRAKGDKAPDQWMPSDPAGRCDYLRQWVEIKQRWGLQQRDAERRFIERGLARCERGEVPELPAG